MLFSAVRHDNAAAIVTALAMGASLRARSTIGFAEITPLALALLHEKTAAKRALIEHGATLADARAELRALARDANNEALQRLAAAALWRPIARPRAARPLPRATAARPGSRSPE